MNFLASADLSRRCATSVAPSARATCVLEGILGAPLSSGLTVAVAICDTIDNCRCPPGGCTNATQLDRARNSSQRDFDSDGLGDSCDPCYASGAHVAPGDGVEDDDFSVWIDTDGDGICNPHDNCAGVRNREQLDADQDGLGDPCDADRDGDGLLNAVDSCPRHAAPSYGQPHADADGDGIGNECDCGGPGAVASAPPWDFKSCEDARSVGPFRRIQEAVGALVRVIDEWELPGPIDEPRPGLGGCLRYPCDGSIDPALAAAADVAVADILALGNYGAHHLVDFVLDAVEGVSVLEAEAYVDWLIESRGKDLVWP